MILNNRVRVGRYDPVIREVKNPTHTITFADGRELPAKRKDDVWMTRQGKMTDGYIQAVGAKIEERADGKAG